MNVVWKFGLGVVLAFGAARAPDEGPDAPAQSETIPASTGALALDYQTFDQAPGAGWRALADRGAYLTAGELIDAYLSTNESLEPSQRVNLAFHAGQAYAFAGAIELAKARFRSAFVENEPSTSPIRWNAYVRATIAFLEGDRATLESMRGEIAAGPDFNGIVPNLDVVDRLLAGFGGPYSEAYRPGAE